MPDVVRAAVEQIIDDEWTATPIRWPGVSFTPPDGPWVAFDILWGDGFRESMDGAHQIVGVLQATVFDERGSGMGQISRLCDDVRSMFQFRRVGDAEFGAASGAKPGAIEERWQSRVVTIDFNVLQ
jgi:hypothetical protein